MSYITCLETCSFKKIRILSQNMKDVINIDGGFCSTERSDKKYTHFKHKHKTGKIKREFQE
jgi:hypothetical protein